jgi:nicotinate-nucleotide adenylyltransferase
MTRLAAKALAAKLAAQGLITRVHVDTLEITRAGPSYMVDSLCVLRQRYGTAVSLSLLIGADQLLRLDTWHDWRKLFCYAHLCVAARPGFDWRNVAPAVYAEVMARQANANALKTSACGHVLLDNSLILNISATDLRYQLAGDPPPDIAITQLPRAVWQYIQRYHLYRT